jgi:sugar phosphate permease
MTRMHSATRPKRFYGWVVVAVALVMNIAASPTNAVAFSFFVEPMSQDLAWSRGELALALSFRLGVAGLTAPFIGVLVDRIGARALGTAAGLVAGLSLLGLAFVHDLWVYYLLFAISGLSGFGGPAGQLLTTVPVAKWFHVKRGRALALASVGMPLGTALYVPVIQMLIDGLGWRTAWFLSGLFVLVLAVPACALFMRKDPESMGLNPDGAESEPLLLSADAPRPARPLEEDWTLKQVLRNRSFWLIIGWVALSGVVVQGALIYRTSYWEDIGISSTWVAAGTALDPLTVVFSGLLFGFLAERVAVRHLGGIGMVGVACSMLPLLLAQNSPIPLFAHNLTWGAFMGANLTANNIIWPDYFGRRHLGTIRGFVFPIAVGSAAISPLFFALLADLIQPFRYVWIVPLAAFATSGLLLFSAHAPRLRSGQQAAAALEATS